MFLVKLSSRLPAKSLGWSQEERDSHAQHVSKFLNAAKFGHGNILKYFVAEGFSVKSKTPSDSPLGPGLTALHIAAREGNSATAELLIEDLGLKVCTKDGLGRTALHFAACSGHENTVRSLIEECHAPVDAQDNRGATAMHTLATFFDPKFEPKLNEHKKQQKVTMMRLLVKEFGASVESKAEFGWTPLHAAAHHQAHQLVCLLVRELNARVSAKDYRGRTCLHLAARTGNIAMVRLLVTELHADINAKSNDGQTALHYAASVLSEEMVCLLARELHANTKLKDKSGRTARQRAEDATGSKGSVGSSFWEALEGVS